MKQPFASPLLRITLGAAMLIAAGCSTLAPGSLKPGTPIAEARAAFLGPTGEYALPNGGTRLEFAQGSFGRQTYMLDFDASGSLVSSQQVLTEATFATIVPGMRSQDVRMRLGRPAQVFNIGWQHLQVWSYRYYPGDCIWYQVSIGDAGTVTEAGYGPDPVCDAAGARE